MTQGMIRAPKQNDILWHVSDHDYGKTNSVFVLALCVPDAATTEVICWWKRPDLR